MEDDHRTPYADDALRVENGTQPEEIQEFVRRRALNPYEFDDLIIWDFNNHALNAEAIQTQADDFLYDEYVIPYQASGVWGYMVTLLPERIQQTEILTYRQQEGTYNPYPNYLRHSTDKANNELRSELAAKLRERDI